MSIDGIFFVTKAGASSKLYAVPLMKIQRALMPGKTDSDRNAVTEATIRNACHAPFLPSFCCLNPEERPNLRLRVADGRENYMTINRDWVIVEEQADSEGVTAQAIYKRIWRGTMREPYVQVGGPNGVILIYNPNAATCPVVNGPQKVKAQSQAVSGKATCDRASNR